MLSPGSIIKFLKESIDVVGDIPGIAAFVKVFFGEEHAKKVGERFLRDVRDELFEDLALLDPQHRNNLERRLREAAAVGREDQLVWDLCKIHREVRQKWALKWLNSLEEQEFREYMDLLRDNKFEQFLTRLSQRFERQFLPAMAHLFGARDMRQLNAKLRLTARNTRADLRREKGWRGWKRLFSF